MSIKLTRWQKPDQGVLFIITGASGTGKTTLVKEALKTIPDLRFSVSATTRVIRSGEVDGVDYFFLNKDNFLSFKEDNAFIESAQVYGNYYGTLKKPVLESLKQGDSILLEIDRRGAEQVKSKMPNAVSIFVLPPSIGSLEIRLRNRATDSEEIIQRRLADARDQLDSCHQFDYLLINDDLESAIEQFQAILVSELLKITQRSSWVQQFSRKKQ
jgi:guanylate kinase